MEIRESLSADAASHATGLSEEGNGREETRAEEESWSLPFLEAEELRKPNRSLLSRRGAPRAACVDALSSAGVRSRQGQTLQQCE